MDPLLSLSAGTFLNRRSMHAERWGLLWLVWTWSGCALKSPGSFISRRDAALALIAAAPPALPVELSDSGPVTEFSVVKDVLRYGESPDQYADLWYLSGHEGTGPRPVIAFLHGGFWREQYNLSNMRRLQSDALRQLPGVVTLNIEYRRGRGSVVDACSDVVSALSALKRVPDLADTRRVALIGHSAGGHLAMWAALRGSPAARPLLEAMALPTGGIGGSKLPPLRCVVSVGGCLDLKEARARNLGNGAVDDFLQGLQGPGTAPSLATFPLPRQRQDLPLDLQQAASPIDLLPPALTSSQRTQPEWEGCGDWQTSLQQTQLALVHGQQDDLVPRDFSTRFTVTAAAGGIPVSYYQIKQEGHFEILRSRSRSWTVARQFISDSLGETSASTSSPDVYCEPARPLQMLPTERTETSEELLIRTKWRCASSPSDPRFNSNSSPA